VALGDGIRRNVAKVSQVERDRLRDAFVALDGTRVFPDGVSFWDKQDQIHQSTHVHNGPAFLPWHRELCNRLEALLREVDPMVSLHYWDWTTDPRATPDGAGGTVNLFTPTFMGSDSGRAGAPFDTFDNNGVFEGSRDQTDNPADPPDLITRSVTPGAPSLATIGFDFKTDAAMVTTGDGAPPDQQFNLMRLALESMHGGIHGYIGGNIAGLHGAFEDPFVFLLHSNVDRLFALWQLAPGQDQRLDPDQVYGAESNTTGLRGILTALDPWAGNPTNNPAILRVRPWAPPENEQVVKNSRDPSVVAPPLYDTNPALGAALRGG
jgi:hypothetical protein